MKKAKSNIEVSVSEAARFLGVSTFRVHRLIARGELNARYEKNEKTIQKSRWFIDSKSLEKFKKRDQKV